MVCVASARSAPPTLWFAQPAVKWTDAMPVGNGRLGAMVFGGVAREHIQFNEDTLWTGRPHDYDRPDAFTHLGTIRKLISEGSIDEAQQLAKAHFLGNPPRQEAYQPFGDIWLDFANPGSGEAGLDKSIRIYRRELNLADGIARVTYEAGGVHYRRDVFASCPDQVIVIRLTADHPGAIRFTVRMTSPHPGTTTDVLGSGELVMRGGVSPDGIRFESRLLVTTEGGRAVAARGGIAVDGADSATLLLVAATSFRNFQDIGSDPGALCQVALARVSNRHFGELLANHEKDYRRLFGRVRFTLGDRDPGASLPTDTRMRRIKPVRLDTDPALVALYFQFGRYLLISSSRAGSQPANLQGVWNDQMDPPWESKWTTNINLEMNYWPAEVTNLSECTAPLFDLIDDLVVSGHRTARAYYNAGGWVLHHNTDLWRGTAPVNGIDGVWPTGGAWLCQHLWEHYLFTGDRAFLANRGYPVMKQAAEFFLEDLVTDPKTGWLVTTPSYSPEQGTLTAGPTMDNELVRALFEHTRAAAGLLGIDRVFAARLADAQAKLPPNQVGRHGQLQEWLADVDKPHNQHRHMSPLWALYPGDDINSSDPRVFAAARKLLTWRGDGSTGWSYAWRIALWARVGDGDFAFRELSLLLDRKTLPSMLDLCGPFQIDGNFGATAAIAEMLLQSQTRTVPGDVGGEPVINLLPALPKAWPDGSISGLRARGNFEVSITWRKGALVHADIRGAPGARCEVKYGSKSAEITLPQSGRYRLVSTS